MSAPVSSLSPHEYLEHLQHQLYGDHLPPYAADVGDVLSANLLASLPPEHRRQLERIAIGVLPTKSVNAWVAAVPSGGEVIGFDFGTMSFLISLNKILLSRTNLFGLEPTLDLTTAANKAIATVRSFSAAQEIPRFLITPRKMLLAASLSNTQTAFIVGHELGHVLLGHLRRLSHDAGPPDTWHDLEFAADERGAELVMNAAGGGPQNTFFGPSDSLLGLAGVDIFFTYMIFMDHIHERSDTLTHPTSQARRERLRARFWNELPENAKALALNAENLFDDFVEICDDEN
jgi:hypothetical protein